MKHKYNIKRKSQISSHTDFSINKTHINNKKDTGSCPVPTHTHTNLTTTLQLHIDFTNYLILKEKQLPKFIFKRAIM
jgi:hypothetical protein